MRIHHSEPLRPIYTIQSNKSRDIIWERNVIPHVQDEDGWRFGHKAEISAFNRETDMVTEIEIGRLKWHGM